MERAEWNTNNREKILFFFFFPFTFKRTLLFIMATISAPSDFFDFFNRMFVMFIQFIFLVWAILLTYAAIDFYSTTMHPARLATCH